MEHVQAWRDWTNTFGLGANLKGFVEVDFPIIVPKIKVYSDFRENIIYFWRDWSSLALGW